LAHTYHEKIRKQVSENNDHEWKMVLIENFYNNNNDNSPYFYIDWLNMNIKATFALPMKNAINSNINICKIILNYINVPELFVEKWKCCQSQDNDCVVGMEFAFVSSLMSLGRESLPALEFENRVASMRQLDMILEAIGICNQKPSMWTIGHGCGTCA
jgi:hypothetical protein